MLDDAAVNAAVAEIGAIDVLFNCAGFVHAGTILEMKDADLDFSLDLNVRSMVRTIRALLPGMLERGGGADRQHVASVAGSDQGRAQPLRLWRHQGGGDRPDQVGRRRLRRARASAATAICPGTVESPSLQDRMRAQGDYETARAAFIARQPMGRLGTPEEIAELAVYLAGASLSRPARPRHRRRLDDLIRTQGRETT